MPISQRELSPCSDDPLDGIIDWCGRWCESAESLLRDWQGWIGSLQTTSDASLLDQAIAKGQPLLRRLQQLMSDRRELLSTNRCESLQRLVGQTVQSESKSLLARILRVQDGLRHLRREAAAQWVANSQLARSVDEILFIVRSGNRHPATYTTDELSAFQGGFLLDSEA